MISYETESGWVNIFDGTTPFIVNSDHEIVAQKLIKEKDEGKYACEISNGISPDLWTEFVIRISGKSFFMLFQVTQRFRVQRKFIRCQCTNLCEILKILIFSMMFAPYPKRPYRFSILLKCFSPNECEKSIVPKIER